MITVSTENIDEPNNSMPIKTKKLSVATHNIRSLNDPSKQNILFSLYDTHHYDIIALQETNFNHDNTSFLTNRFLNTKLSLVKTVIVNPMVSVLVFLLAPNSPNIFSTMIPNTTE